MISKINTSAVVGIDAIGVEVEADISNGLPSFTIVGLPDKAVDEAKDRVKSAIKNSYANFPTTKVVVNLAPADIPKAGPVYDLPIAIAILSAYEQIPLVESSSIFIGELSLDGNLRHTNGILPTVIMAKENGLRRVFLPKTNAKEASLIDGIDIVPVNNLRELILYLKKEIDIRPFINLEEKNEEAIYELDFCNVSGQEAAKRALEIAAAGGHNIFMTGPPGAGKTLLAKSFPSILPDLTKQEIVEITKIYSTTGLLGKTKSAIKERPFRAPHHTASDISLIGGGKNPRPGEISLSHRGVLFLDELPEFPKNVLEVLRQPLESGDITISRAVGSLSFPANFILIAAANPCPCGYYGSGDKECFCAPNQIAKYKKKISGPLLDRIDIHIQVSRVKYDKLTKETGAQKSVDIRRRVNASRELQKQRFKETELLCNSEMGTKEIKIYCKINQESDALLHQAANSLKLSARAIHKILKLARTIADLENSEQILTNHIAEAIQFRPRD